MLRAPSRASSAASVSLTACSQWRCVSSFHASCSRVWANGGGGGLDHVGTIRPVEAGTHVAVGTNCGVFAFVGEPPGRLFLFVPVDKHHAITDNVELACIHARFLLHRRPVFNPLIAKCRDRHHCYAHSAHCENNTVPSRHVVGVTRVYSSQKSSSRTNFINMDNRDQTILQFHRKRLQVCVLFDRSQASL